jgi:hypothetical protein
MPPSDLPRQFRWAEKGLTDGRRNAFGEFALYASPRRNLRLRSNDAHCSYEAAELLECALDVLRAPNATRAYESITKTIAELAITLPQRHGDLLPCDTRYFLDVVGDDYCEAFGRRGQQEIVAGLTPSHP